MFVNPIDKDKVAEHPGLLPYAHNIGSILVKPDDVGKLKSRALLAMQQQTAKQMQQIQKQFELLVEQATEIKRRVEVSEKIYTAILPFEPFVGNTYHLYEQEGVHKLMLIGPTEWGKSKKESLHFICSVTLLSDHTWDIV